MDAIAFQAEAMQHQKLLFHVSYAILKNNQDCADAVQDALLRAWESRGQLRDSALFRPWLTRILVNTCNSMIRKRSKLRLVPLQEDLADDGFGARDGLPLRDALERLSPDLRLATVLHYLEGFSVREVAQMVDAPEGTVKTRLMYARRSLQAMLVEEVKIG